jgi:hypothetical protein
MKIGIQYIKIVPPVEPGDDVWTSVFTGVTTFYGIIFIVIQLIFGACYLVF